MLVVMNLYPLRARLPRNLAGVEDRMHELSYGNRLRQDHDTARRINALVETIEDLAALVPSGALDERMHARLDEARRYKVIDAIVNVDMQDPAVTLVPAAQRSADKLAEAKDGAGYPVTAQFPSGVPVKAARAVLKDAEGKPLIDFSAKANTIPGTISPPLARSSLAASVSACTRQKTEKRTITRRSRPTGP